jgi:hypothetical protein
LSSELKHTARIGKGEAVALDNDSEFDIDISSVGHLTLPQLATELVEECLNDIYLAISYRGNDVLRAFPNSNILPGAEGWIFVTLTGGVPQITLTAKISRGLYRAGQDKDDAIATARRIVEAYGFEILSTRFANDEGIEDVLELDVRPDTDVTLLQTAYLQCIVSDCTEILSPHSPVSIIGAVLSGHADRLIGVRENSCFDVKRTYYDRENDLSRHDFACDVAAFANSPAGGLILLGAQTKETPEGDVVSSLPGCQRDLGAQESYQRIIENLIAPPITGLSYFVAPHRDDREIFMVFIPPQAPAALPFIVKGGVRSNGNYSSSMFSVPIRHLDCNIPALLSEVQRYLAVGQPRS